MNSENEFNYLGFNEIKDNREGRIILTICDISILGKTFEDGNKVLFLSKDYFLDKKLDEAEFLNKLSTIYMIHAVGKQAIEMLLKLNIIKGRNVCYIKEIPYCMVVFG